MSKLVILSIIVVVISFFLMLFGHNNIDTAFLNWRNYHVEASVFTLIALLLISLCVIVVSVKLLFWILDLPSIVKNKFHDQVIYKNNDRLIKAVGQNIVGNKKSARDLVKKISKLDNDSNKALYSLLQGESSDKLDEQITAYSKLLESKDYKAYAYKKLADLFYHKKFYEQAEEYALSAYNLSPNDDDVLIRLAYCYAHNSKWDKFHHIISILTKQNSAVLKKNAKELSNYSLISAKQMVTESNDYKAELYAQTALSLNPELLEAINLYIELAISNNKIAQARNMLKILFKNKPSIEVAQLYVKISDLPAEKIFEELISLAKNKHDPLFIVLANILKLPNKAMSLIHELSSNS